MRIGFDLFEHATYPFRGIGRYEQYLAQALMAQDNPAELIFISPPNRHDLLPGLTFDDHNFYSC